MFKIKSFLHFCSMGNDTDIRFKADRIFVKQLCAITGKSASALAAGANMAATTLNRFVSGKVKPTSTLKDLTIEKIAKRWGLDYLRLTSYRKEIEEALRAGKAVPDFENRRLKTGARARSRSAGLKEPPPFRPFEGPSRDPLMDQIMGAAYDIWFNASYRDAVAFERLPDLVRLLYGRTKLESKVPPMAEIKKRIADMLAVMALEKQKKS